jgi:hypothetical protein
MNSQATAEESPASRANPKPPDLSPVVGYLRVYPNVTPGAEKDLSYKRYIGHGVEEAAFLNAAAHEFAFGDFAAQDTYKMHARTKRHARVALGVAYVERLVRVYTDHCAKLSERIGMRFSWHLISGVSCTKPQWRDPHTLQFEAKVVGLVRRT